MCRSGLMGLTPSDCPLSPHTKFQNPPIVRRLALRDIPLPIRPPSPRPRLMIHVTPFQRLGSFRNDWLDAHHHFSFGSYYDPNRMGFGPLRVWNDDHIAAGTGFDMHGHRDMEIITYVRKGAITHQDHLRNVGRTEAGDVQVMSAGKGILHA